MSHALTALVGTKVIVRVRNEDNVYEGFFHCFSQNMDLVVSGVHKVHLKLDTVYNCLDTQARWKWYIKNTLFDFD